jgi:hypothetical protein
MFWRWFGLLVGALLGVAVPAAHADPVPLNTDVAVTLTAIPTTNLVSGESVVFTMTVIDNGPLSLGYFAIIGPQISGQFSVPSGTWNDCGLFTTTGDSDDGPFWTPEWFPSGLGENPMAVGETRTCHFTLTVASGLPRAYAFTMFLPDYWSDINSSNSSATVSLQRAIDVVPALSIWMLAFLTASLIAASHFWRYLNR